ncbi:MAG: hypothetical protein HZB56_08415 [Deltaproteobacteria bacterium]|nr:hypothetical protein [Deltaproteobacteria bacterium]
MAAPSLRTVAWALAALAAAGALAALALHGERPEAGLARFQAAGVMVDRDTSRASAIEVLRDGRRWRYQRGPSGWAAAPGSPAGPRQPGPTAELGLRLLHGSIPQRVMAAEEVRAMSLAEVGLLPPALVVRVEFPGEPSFALELGSRNPQGQARYARRAGSAEVLLLNAFVADPFQALTEER